LYWIEPVGKNGNTPAHRNALADVVKIVTLVHAVLKTAGNSRFKSTTPVLSTCQRLTASNNTEQSCVFGGNIPTWISEICVNVRLQTSQMEVVVAF